MANGEQLEQAFPTILPKPQTQIIMQRLGKTHGINYRLAIKISTILAFVLAYAILCLAIFLRAKRAVSSTIALGVDLSIALSILSLCILGARFYLQSLHSQKLRSNTPITSRPVLRLGVACRQGTKCLLWFWTALSGWNLVIAVRAPICVRHPSMRPQGGLFENSWKFGFLCRIHRTIVAFSIILLICLLLVYFTTYCRSSQGYVPGSYMIPYDKKGQLYLVSERRPSRLEREQWLQRRNSMSSQKAIFPHRIYSHPFEHWPRYAMYSYAPTSHNSSTLRSVSEGACLDLSDRNSSPNSSQSSGSSTRSPRASTSQLPSRRLPNSSPEKLVAIRENKGSPKKNSIRDVPPLPAPPAPTWSPALHHTPLSADPLIRALTTGGAGGQRMSLLYSRSSPALVSQLPPRSRSVEPAMRSKSQNVADVTSVPTIPLSDAQTVSPPIQTAIAPPRPSIPPPAPPLTSILPLIPVPANPTSIPPAIPLRAAGHSMRRPPTATTNMTASPSASSLRPALRRPSPIRNRSQQSAQYHPHLHHAHHAPQHSLNYYYYYYYTPQQHIQKYQGQLIAQAGAGAMQFHHQHRTYRRPGRRGCDPVSSSVYSASSYGTSRTMASSASAASKAR
ncbi:uncharacterized protein A1O9_01633 [Exophiala aquamarina CBS 119918]|uniref:Uncharacterized protein n=1 Tax=Exophiala aquamarina CBS 119918 TaxID=1182545 RepID=A0A072Q6T9_9EURO|nr:uncharacterized protein A1O9_01633 [Exophiala aquamarina CBS 119918]KEF63655.1 hypothetical protein A1O9_01633 [Exophiala aquamarina CBS 119918]